MTRSKRGCEPRPGGTLGTVVSTRFQIIRLLGEGGMGVVYEALDRERGGRVALKTLRNANPEHLARLKREFRAMQDVHHDNLVALHELLSEDDQWFVTMDLVEGVDLLEHVRSTDLAGPTPSRVSAFGEEPTQPFQRAEPPAGPADRPVFDDEKLRTALRQLADGLQALHAAGMVHRDVKPRNVLVTRAGRVVLLDFGLVSDTRDARWTQGLVGTPAYMAPEQAADGAVGPGADWYAVGVILYEAITGRLPFEGKPLEMVMRKQSEVPAAPSTLAAGVPADLEALALALLRADPRARASGDDVRRRCGAPASLRTRGPLAPPARGDDPSGRTSRTLSPPFVGRTRELEVLTTALHDSRRHGLAVVIHGESGVGKSRLVRQFLERVTLESAESMVVAGRCYERESVPYKAFDGMVEALARLLARMPDAQARALLPTQLAPLIQVFPALRRVSAVAERTRTTQPALDPFELRTRAFGSLRQLLVRAGERRPLVVVIDDAQWADHDSLALLTEIARVPEAPQMLLILGVRAGSGNPAQATGGDSLVGQSRALVQAIGMPVREIDMPTLSIEESRELAVALSDHLGGGALSEADLDAIAHDACGHPLFVDLLTRAAERRAPHFSERLLRASRKTGAEEQEPRSVSSGHLSAMAASQLDTPRLGEALTSEMASLDPAEREILDMVSVAGVPLAQGVAERATRLAPERFARALQRLRVGRFLVTTGSRDQDRIEPYHDRVRVVVVGAIGKSRRRDLHRRIASALETDVNADAEALAHHWRAAGEFAHAARFSTLAGDAAKHALAFERAAKFYEDALDMDPPADEQRRALLVKLGDALANAGRGKRAADVFRDAASGAPPPQALEMQRRAAEELMRSGHFDEGIAVIRTVLAAVDMSLPKSAFWRLVSLVALRLVVGLRGLGFTPRDPTELSPAELTRIDICWSVALGLGFTDTTSGALFQLRCLLLALRAGERARVARAIATHTLVVAMGGYGARARVAQVVSAAESVVRELPSAYARAWTQVCHGTAQFLLGEFRGARKACDTALAQLRDECSGSHWEVDIAIQFGMQALFYLGELRELGRRVSSQLRAALDRGDVYAAVILRTGDASTAWLATDEPEKSLANVEAAMREWSKAGFHLEHYYELYARTNIDLYRGATGPAYARTLDRWGPLRRSLLLQVQFVRFTMLGCRARAAIAAARDESGQRRTELIAAARRDLRRIAGERVPWSMALVKLWSAGAESVASGDPARVTALLRDAIVTCEAANLDGYAALAKRRLGETVGGDEGAELARTANVWFAREGIAAPARFAATFAPGFTEPMRTAEKRP